MGFTHPQASGTNTSIKQHGIQEPAIQYRPPQWTLIFYAILVMSLIVGISSYLNGSTAQVSILRFVSFLLGASILSICFLWFVIIPVHVKRYHAFKAPRKLHSQQREQISHPGDFSEDIVFKNNQVPTDNGAAPIAMSQNAHNVFSGDSATIADLDTVLKLRTQVESDNSTANPEKLSVEDQASSLRRIVSSD